MDNKRKEDDNNLDNYHEDSIFSITEDAQYPIFDAGQAKAGILTKKKKSPHKKGPQVKPKPEEGIKILSSFGHRYNYSTAPKLGGYPGVKFNDSYGLKDMKLDVPLLLNREPIKSATHPVRPTSSFTNHSMGLSLGNLPTFGRGRPIGVVRPTPMMKSHGGIASQSSTSEKKITIIESKEELSPRSKMLPGLVARVNTIKGNGSFSPFNRVAPTSSIYPMISNA